MEKDLDDVLSAYRITVDKTAFVDRMCTLASEDIERANQPSKWQYAAMVAMLISGFLLGASNSSARLDGVQSAYSHDMRTMLFATDHDTYFFM